MTTTAGPPGRGGRQRQGSRLAAGPAQIRIILFWAIPPLRAGLAARHPDLAPVQITSAQAEWLAAAESELWPRRWPRMAGPAARLVRWLDRPVLIIWIPVPLRGQRCALASRVLGRLVRPLVLAAAALAAGHALLAACGWADEVFTVLLFLAMMKLVTILARPLAAVKQDASADAKPRREQ